MLLSLNVYLPYISHYYSCHVTLISLLLCCSFDNHINLTIIISLYHTHYMTRTLFLSPGDSHYVTLTLVLSLYYSHYGTHYITHYNTQYITHSPLTKKLSLGNAHYNTLTNCSHYAPHILLSQYLSHNTLTIILSRYYSHQMYPINLPSLFVSLLPSLYDCHYIALTILLALNISH